jgi:hypothetical protein
VKEFLILLCVSATFFPSVIIEDYPLLACISSYIAGVIACYIAFADNMLAARGEDKKEELGIMEKWQKDLLDIEKSIENRDSLISELRDCLTELHAMVEGECPSLLNEDSGGSSSFEMRLRDLFARTENYK